MAPKVATGLRRFIDSGGRVASLRAGTRVALVAHAASVDENLVHAADLLHRDPRVELVRLLAPEHGVRGDAQDMEAVREPADSSTGVPVVSLYGADEGSLRPAIEHLADVDAVVYDLQDVGSRYYTFVTTLSFVMEAARDAAIPVIVLDRPNPIGGTQVEGPVLDLALASFVGRFPLPVRHGMTTGELALLFRDAFGLACDLRIVPMDGWSRAMQFEDTGLPWVLPSPNMPTPDTARVYPGGCLVEGTNLSEGRGTTRPFELVGAPWIDAPAFAREVAAACSREGVSGVSFRAAYFRPTFHKHARVTCGGVQAHVTDRRLFRPFASYLVLLREARRHDVVHFDWRRDPYEFVSDRLAIDLLLGRHDLRPMIESGAPVEEMEACWTLELGSFLERRRERLLYPCT